MNDHIDALHIGTITVGCGLFVVASAAGQGRTLLDALPFLMALGGVALHRTGRLDDDPAEQGDATDGDVRESVESLEERPAPRMDTDAQPATDGGEA